MKPILHSLTLALLFVLTPKYAIAADPINFGKATVNVGATKTVSSSDETQKTMMSYATKFSWTSANTDYVQVVSSTASSCKIKGIKATTSAVKLKYTATIVMSYPPGPISFEGYFSITVNDNSTKVTKIKIIPESVVLKPLQTEQLTAQVLPENATNKSVSWNSSDSNIATVDQNGLVTAQTPGTATISATATDGSGMAGTCQVDVEDSSSDVNDKDDESVQNTNVLKLLPIVELNGDLSIFNNIFPACPVTIELKNGETFFFSHTPADYDKCVICFGNPVSVEGLYVEGFHSIHTDQENGSTSKTDSERILIDKGTKRFKTNSLSNQSGVLKLVNESGEDVSLNICGVTYYTNTFNGLYFTTSKLYLEDEVVDPGYTLITMDPETQLPRYKEVAGQIYNGFLSMITGPVASAAVRFSSDFKSIGGEQWATDAQKTVYLAEFTDPVPNANYKWFYTTKKGGVKYQAIDENSNYSSLIVNEPLASCEIVYDGDSFSSDRIDNTLNICSVKMLQNPDCDENGGILGDVNKDEKVDISDIVAIINIIAGK